jgi:hypothetical protein
MLWFAAGFMLGGIFGFLMFALFWTPSLTPVAEKREADRYYEWMDQ